jgi:glycosyltransferase involved in cell wall biosynthesis
MKVLVIDKTAVLYTSQQKCMELAKFADVDLSLLCPECWVENFTEIHLEKPVEPNYKMYIGKVIFKGYENRGFYYKGILKAIGHKPEIIFLIEEPYSFFAFQTIVLKSIFSRRSKIIFYTWDNLSKRFKYPYRPSLIYELISQLTFKLSHYALTANSEAIEVLKSKGFNKPIQYVPYGIDLSVFSEKDMNILKKELNLKNIVFGYIGRLLESKGLDTFLKAVALYKKEFGEEFSILIIGRGEYKENLLEIAKEYGLITNLILIDAIPHQMVADYMNCLDILVLPSKTTLNWKEQFGRVLIEAMACGVSVIGSSSGAIPEIIGEAGLIFQEGNPKDLKEKIVQLVNDEDLRNKLKVKGKIRAREFSWGIFAKEVYEIFNRVIKNENRD